MVNHQFHGMPHLSKHIGHITLLDVDRYYISMVRISIGELRLAHYEAIIGQLE